MQNFYEELTQKQTDDELTEKIQLLSELNLSEVQGKVQFRVWYVWDGEE